MSELVYLDFGAARVDYREAWDLQRRVHARRVAGQAPDSCLLLEHEPVYTAGKRTAASDRPFGDPGAPVTAERVRGRSGAWVPGDESGPDRKVGAIGARVARGVTMHGFALNADCDLSWYDRIVPCGIRDAGTTTLTAETGRRITVAQITPVMK